MPVRTVLLLAFEGTQLLDVTGPAEVFGVANAMAGGEATAPPSSPWTARTSPAARAFASA
jgi:transcriptional regulator GlxA family with amidase domain